MEEILRVDGLTKSYGSRQVLRDVSFSLQEGQCLTLMGVNGAGKTTLCEILQGLRSPDAGRIYMFGHDLARRDHRKRVLKNIGVVLQETALYKRFTVDETLSLFASFYDQVLPWDDLLDRLSLFDCRKRLLKDLSGGQKQKVYLACALLHRPRLLFWDEPTTGLDPQSREQVWDLVGELKNQGCAVLLTTHDLEEAERLSDRLVLIDEGSILADGALNELIPRYADHTNLFMRFNLLELRSEGASDDRSEASWAELRSGLSSLPGVEKVLALRGDPPELEIHLPRDHPPPLDEILSWVKRSIFELSDMSLRRGSLREVYRALTGKVMG